jgi:exopolysaccharide biosynthesis polyprenyl glycosylphosphotransferase
MEERQPGLLSKAHLWTDVILLNFSFFAAYYLRFHQLKTGFDNQYIILLLEANLVWIFVIYLLKTYLFTRLSFNFRNQLVNLFKAALLHAAIIMGILYLNHEGEDYSRKQFLMTYGIFLSLALLMRAGLVLYIYMHRQAGYNSSRYAILGKGDLATMIHDFYNERKELGYRFCGIYAFDDGSDHLDSLEQLMAQQKLDYVYCCLSEMTDQQVRSIIRLGERQKTHIRLVPDFRGFITNKATIEYHDMMPIIHVNTRPFSNVNEQYLKRSLDLVFSCVVMILGSPVFLAVMLAIKISSPGPVFYRQKRCGQWGQMFYIYKFRSMVINADQLGQHSQGDQDPRITSIGRLLRKSRLDELPQFINVLRGEMSVVGPRPLYKYDVDMLMEAAPHDFQRLLTVKPGITSIGQIQVGYADTVSKNVERLKYDLTYLKEYSVLDDIGLIVKTMQVMLSGRGQ